LSDHVPWLMMREQVIRLVDKLAPATMGSKDCCSSNFTLFKTILIYNAVKDWILGHLNLILGPRSFSNHRLDFKFLTLHEIKMTQKWINEVDNGSNKVQRMFVFQIIILLQCTLPMVLPLGVSSLFANRISIPLSNKPRAECTISPMMTLSLHLPFHSCWCLHYFTCRQYLQPLHQACITMEIWFLPYLPVQSGLPGTMICTCGRQL
jgi:hypothetical protein